jgi:hypothetical protein
MAPRKVNKSAKTGKFVSNKELKAKPSTTFRETTKPKAKPSKKK